MTEHIDRYEIVSELGQGGMAVVYKALDPTLHRHVAIKLLREEQCTSTAFRQRFVQEARTMGNLSHPNIVKIYDVGEWNNRPYIAMELLEGHFLEKKTNAGERLAADVVIEIGRQLALALICVHASNTVHRDIKPANIALLPGNQIKLSDFGIAHVEKEGLSPLTQTGEMLGTPHYMSPEQILGKPADARSDLYAVGVILYELVAGRRPFETTNLANLVYQISHENHTPLPRMAQAFPKALIAIIDRLLSKKPEQRFQNATELLAALDEVKQFGDKIDTSKPGNRTKYAPVGVIAGLIGAGLLAYTIMRPNETATPVTPVAPPPIAAASVEKMVTNKIKGLECAELVPTFINGTLTVRGFVGKDEDSVRVMEALEKIPGVTNTVFEIETKPWPECAVASLTDATHQNSPRAPGVNLLVGDGRNMAQPGQALKMEIALGDAEAFVYVDYFRPDGSVTHVLPGQKQAAATIAAGSKLKLGAKASTSGGGDDLVLVMATREPLPSGNRPSSEQAQDYLAFLYQQVHVAKREMRGLYQIITVENPS